MFTASIGPGLVTPEHDRADWLFPHPQNNNFLQVEAMQRHPAKDILEEEEDGKYTKSGVQ